MDWAIIDEIFVNAIFTEMTDPLKGKVWLAEVKKHPDGLRLLACIAIDVLCKAVEGRRYATIIDNVTEFTYDSFNQSIIRSPDSHLLRCCSTIKPSPLALGDRYVRVVEILNFRRFYLSQYPYTNSPEDIQDIRDNFFDGNDFVDWVDLNQAWSGGLPLVFVLSYRELRELITTGLNKGDIVNDALGLNYVFGGATDGKPDFLGVVYPESFTTICRQPTALDVPWDGSWFYLSYYNEDSWGRTQSCSGVDQRVKERVHPALDTIDPYFSGCYIGPAVLGLRKDRIKLLEEAVRRLNIAHQLS
jgi:hypothetical protein